jgi:hypothetical protein
MCVLVRGEGGQQRGGEEEGRGRAAARWRGEREGSRESEMERGEEG